MEKEHMTFRKLPCSYSSSGHLNSVWENRVPLSFPSLSTKLHQWIRYLPLPFCLLCPQCVQILKAIIITAVQCFIAWVQVEIATEFLGKGVDGKRFLYLELGRFIQLEKSQNFKLKTCVRKCWGKSRSWQSDYVFTDNVAYPQIEIVSGNSEHDSLYS